MATNKDTQDVLEDNHQSIESNKSRALTVQTLSDALANTTLDDQTDKDTQDVLEDYQQFIESDKSRALTLQTLPDALANTTLDDQTNKHPACTAVFETNELLCLILSQVPKGPLTTPLRVSKTWNSVVHKIGYCVQPSNARPDLLVYLESLCGHIDFHPIINCWTSQNATKFNNKMRLWTMGFRVDNYYPSVLHRFGYQYLTSPPITHLSLKVITDIGRPNHMLASLKVKDGIRLRDVAEVLDKLHQSTPLEYLHWRERSGGLQDFVFAAVILCARAGSEREIYEREERMYREVRGWRNSWDCNPLYLRSRAPKDGK